MENEARDLALTVIFRKNNNQIFVNLPPNNKVGQSKPLCYGVYGEHVPKSSEDNDSQSVIR